MACSGLAIPANEKSSIYVFDQIFADIGDNQSILESLSTFSSHITNIVEITKCATKNSLILLDELGSGTDPLEGANLAISILEYFHNLGALTIATTHYQELKKYAFQTQGFQNASVEFDIEHLKPTYNLILGIPGKSNAFEISRKLGLQESIIQKASSRLNSEEESMEQIIKELQDTKQQLNEDKKQTQKNLLETENIKAEWKEKQYKLEQEKQSIILNAKAQARKLLLEAKEEIDYALKNLNNTSISELNNIRNKLNKNIQKNSTTIINTHSNKNSIFDISDLHKGQKVYISTFKQNGIILSVKPKNKEAQVQIGNIKTNVPISCLEIAKKEKEQAISPYKQNTSIIKNKQISTEINIIGLNVEEAIMLVDKFLDDASLAKLSTVHIVHGKGTGRLKNGIHQFLKKNPHVKNFRLGTFGEGEMGVTVVELK